ncbi:hypothetical protein, partial [Staphylococcus aureus]|uniref:hypothetical protein n=1 Tax=Staphylococcus aureus TaxID=1280 RepID=UPI0038B288C0
RTLVCDPVLLEIIESKANRISLEGNIRNERMANQDILSYLRRHLELFQSRFESVDYGFRSVPVKQRFVQ